jgi:hypothetical protein
MHNWSDESVDWSGIDAAAEYIGTNLRKWGRIDVRQYKEKWGTVRVYCNLGWHQIHCITHPGHCFNRYPQWLWQLDCRYGRYVAQLLNKVVVPYHVWLYRRVYRLAVNKWPHLEKEITCQADYQELLRK